jgi:hypothetical protein
MMTTPRSMLAQIFLSPNERRLRAGWRLLIQSILLLVILSIISIAVVILTVFLGIGLNTLPPLSLFNLLPTALSMTLAVWMARRLLDRRSFASLGFQLDRRALIDLAVGFLIPGAMMGVIFLLEVALGWVRFDGWAWQSMSAGRVVLGVLSGLLGFAVVGYQEELLSRGYHLQNIRDGMGLGWGLMLSSGIFALMHLGNPNVTWYTTLPGLLVAGYFLAYGWVRTRQLWLSIGLHIGWNFFEGSVFGFPVSGIDLVGLIRQTPTGPVTFTGGPFGPEAGLVLVPAIAVGVALVWWYTRRRPIPSQA